MVAIEVLPADVTDTPDALPRFEREARVVSTLGHPISALSSMPAGTTVVAGRHVRRAGRTRHMTRLTRVDYWQVLVVTKTSAPPMAPGRFEKM